MTNPDTRRLRRSILLAGAALMMPTAWAQQAPVQIDVWKSPSCGCCKDWVAHMEAAGFHVVVHETGNAVMRERLGIPVELGSCHTARVAGYALEGHVPAADVRRLLRERPQALGLVVPRMPIGSPGMDGPEYRGRRDPYDVLLLAKQGGTRVFASHR